MRGHMGIMGISAGQEPGLESHSYHELARIAYKFAQKGQSNSKVQRGTITHYEYFYMYVFVMKNLPEGSRVDGVQDPCGKMSGSRGAVLVYL